ncbi:uncharacterized protein LOC126776420 [Nymphalis io]|uniref:uncharacterized protein LOC126776420 n=1 Tax=Inachis io TaxID=171585 RepID=UPI00216A4447|nr:uncharacterized protein LOC126776420 [Nymphalis io]
MAQNGATWRLPAYTASTSRSRVASKSSNRRLNSQLSGTQGNRGTRTSSSIRSGPASLDIRNSPNSSGTRNSSRGSRTTSDTSSALSTRVLRQATPKPTDDIPVFDRNKVSLDFPGSLFGPSVSLLIRTTKIVGDVIQNSAVRYQSFLRLFRPLFRGPFEIKGLDPPTTTTTRRPTTTTTTTPAPPSSDNEISRRR